jgi:hypothetical protein
LLEVVAIGRKNAG